MGDVISQSDIPAYDANICKAKENVPSNQEDANSAASLYSNLVVIVMLLFFVL